MTRLGLFNRIYGTLRERAVGSLPATTAGTGRTRPSRRSRNLRLESLEPRMVLAGTPTVLFLGANATPTHSADGDVWAHLQTTFGPANVTYKQSGAANNTTDLVGVDVLVLSSSAGSGDYRNKFHNSPVGVLNWEEAVMDAGAGEFGLSSAQMTKSITTTQMTIEQAHPITTGLSGTIDFVLFEELCVPRGFNLYLIQHLPDNDFNVFVID